MFDTGRLSPSEDDISVFVSRLVEAEVSEAQLGAWLMATYMHGLSVQVGVEPRNITSDTGQHSGDSVPHPRHGRQRREPGVARLLPQPRGGQAQHRRGRGQGDSISAPESSIRMFVITEKAPTRAFSWLKAATTGSATQLS